MPSGYTAPIEEEANFTFDQYVWRCARAFTPLMHMRDEPWSAPIKLTATAEDFSQNAYHTKQVQDEQDELAALEKLSTAEVDQGALASHERAVKRWEASEVKRKDKVQRYDAMLAKCRAFDPPTTEHEGLQRFMIEQIEQSCGTYDRKPEERPVPRSAAEWIADQKGMAQRRIDYHTRQLKEEGDRGNDHSGWLTELARVVPIPKDLVK